MRRFQFFPGYVFPSGHKATLVLDDDLRLMRAVVRDAERHIQHLRNVADDVPYRLKVALDAFNKPRKTK